MNNRRKTYRKYVVFGITISLALAVTAICVVSYKNTITPAGIIIHHSALPYPQLEPEAYLPLITEIHRRRDYGIFYWGRMYYEGYHYVILPDGTIKRGRPDHCRGAHAQGFNSYIGICVVGDFSTTHNPDGSSGPLQPSDEQIKSLAELCCRLITEFRIPPGQLLRHSDVNQSTECPGDRFPFQVLIKEIGTKPRGSEDKACSVQFDKLVFQP